MANFPHATDPAGEARRDSALPDEAREVVPTPPKVGAAELDETVAVIQRGRELLRKARDAAEAAGHQADETQAAMERTDRALDRAMESIGKIDGDEAGQEPLKP